MMTDSIDNLPHLLETPPASSDITLTRRTFLTSATVLLTLPALVRGQTKNLPATLPSPLRSKPYLMAQLGHSNDVTSVAFSADGKYVLTGSGSVGGKDNTARLWETATGKEVRRFQGHSAGVMSVAFSSDSRFVLTGSEDKTSRLWEIATGKEIRPFEGHSGVVTSAVFSPTGKTVLTGSKDNTARLWETATGKEVRRFQGHSEGVMSVAFSSDDRFVLTGSADTTARLWENATGKEIIRFEGHSNRVNSVMFSPDGNYVLTGSGDTFEREDYTARLWKTANGKEVRRFQGHSGVVTSVVFSSDGKSVLTGSKDNTARLWETATGKEIRRFQGHSAGVMSVAFSSDSRFVLTGSGDLIGKDMTAHLWEIATGKEVRRFEGHSAGLVSVAFSSDGKYVLTGSIDKTARLWDTMTGKEIRLFQGHSEFISSVAISSDGRYVLTGSGDATARLWETETGKEVRRIKEYSDAVAVAFSLDGKYMLTGGNTANLWETATGKEVQHYEGSPNSLMLAKFSPHGKRTHTYGPARRSDRILSVAFSPNDKYVLTGSEDKTAHLWETAAGKEVRRFEGHSAGVASATFSSDGKYVLTGSGDATARLWETSTGKEVRRFEGHADWVNSVAFSSDGKYVLTGSWDGTTRLWETATGQELCSLISFRDGTWAVTDPSGRYDASNAGDVNGLCWVVDNRSIDLAQLKERYYEPGLLAKILAGQPLRPVAAFENVPLFPEVAQQALGNNRYSVHLSDLGGGIGKVQVYVNNVRFLEDARPVNADPKAKTLSFTVDVSQAPTLRQGGNNEVRVVAYNAAGWLPSRGIRSENGPVDNPNVPRRLYAIIAGISDYAGPNLHLGYAANDAESFAQAVQLSARNFQAIVGTEIHLFSSSGAKGTLPATKDNLKAAFEEVRRKAKPEDILLVYLAGHGVSLSLENGLYCFLTQNANSADTTKLTTDTTLRQATTLTSAELGGWLTGREGIRAGYRVMVLDTCAAGAAEAKLTEKRDAPTDQILAMERFKDRTGFHLLMGCAADQVSYEASPYGHGLLTYALLQGMQGAALRDGDWVDVRTLFGYAEDQVPKLMAGLQQPRYQKPGAGSFDIGKLPVGERKQIVLAQPKPLVLRPTLLNGVKLRDDLNLSNLLAKQLRSVSEVNARGAALVYVEAEALPGGVIPSGTYRVEGEAIRVQLVLSRDEKESARLSVEGTKGDIPALIRKLSDAITMHLN